MPVVSIIVPVYNAEQYLSGCISSILSQSYADFELLLVDDGSTDGGGAVCDAFAKKDNRVHVFHKENGGASSARNIGLKEARGEWVCFVDADDEMLPGGLQFMVAGISDEVDMVMAGYEVYENNGSLVYSLDGLVEKSMDIESMAKEMFEPTDYYYQGYICAKALRMSVLKCVGLCFAEDMFFNEDHLFLTEFICSMGRGAYYSTRPVYKYFERPNSAMMSIKKGFNPRFVTDMESQIRMRDAVRARFNNAHLLDLANKGVFLSYRRIVGSMDQFAYKDKSLKKDLRRRMVKAIGLFDFIRYEIQRDKRRIVKKLIRLTSDRIDI